jgi:hypothetical protein
MKVIRGGSSGVQIQCCSERRVQKCSKRNYESHERDERTNASSALPRRLLKVASNADGINQELGILRRESEGSHDGSNELSIRAPQPVCKTNGEKIDVLNQISANFVFTTRAP